MHSERCTVEIPYISTNTLEVQREVQNVEFNIILHRAFNAVGDAEQDQDPNTQINSYVQHQDTQLGPAYLLCHLVECIQQTLSSSVVDAGNRRFSVVLADLRRFWQKRLYSYSA